jgi:outer membrane immunogenic protein
MQFLKPAIVGSTFVLLIGTVHAADMATPKTAMPILPPPVQPTMEWTGFYVGLNGGYGWSEALNVSIVETARNKSFMRSSTMPGGFVGGGQAGYNWQSGHWVFGFEADIQYVDLGGAVEWNGFEGLRLSSGQSQYMGTVRARLGYAIDRTMFYATGGFAYGGLIENPLSGDSTSNQGFAVGGGFEYAFTENWTGRIEGLYLNLESKAKSTSATMNGSTYVLTARPGDGAGLMRVGVNYKF